MSAGRWERNSCLSGADSGAPPESSTVSEDRSYVAAVELVEQRTREGVADDEEEGDPLLLDERPDVGGVEPFGLALDEDRAATVEREKAHPVAGAVHERGSEHRAQPALGARRAGDEVVVALERGAVVAAAAQGLDEDVGLSPEHALRHARRAAGVEDVEVVGRRRHRRRLGGRRRERVLVPLGAGEQVVARLVGDLQQHGESGKRVAHLGERRCERGVVDDRLRAGVGEQVEQLLGDVAVVHVERCDPRLERAEHRLEVLVAVVEVDGEVVLARLVPGELSTLDDACRGPGPTARSRAVACGR